MMGVMHGGRDAMMQVIHGGESLLHLSTSAPVLPSTVLPPRLPPSCAGRQVCREGGREGRGGRGEGGEEGRLTEMALAKRMKKRVLFDTPDTRKRSIRSSGEVMN